MATTQHSGSRRRSVRSEHGPQTDEVEVAALARTRTPEQVRSLGAAVGNRALASAVAGGGPATASVQRLSFGGALKGLLSKVTGGGSGFPKIPSDAARRIFDPVQELGWTSKEADALVSGTVDDKQLQVLIGKWAKATGNKPVLTWLEYDRFSKRAGGKQDPAMVHWLKSSFPAVHAQFSSAIGKWMDRQVEDRKAFGGTLDGKDDATATAGDEEEKEHTYGLTPKASTYGHSPR